MLPTTTKRILLAFAILGLGGFGVSWATDSSGKKVEFVQPIPQLFSHKGHSETFRSSGVQCTDCHSFSVKAPGGDPLSKGVEKGFLKPDYQSCHQCHMGHVSLPKPNECSVCHTNTRNLAPSSHSLNWKKRHGSMAQSDPESCRSCHSEKSCSQCHTQRDTLKPRVHRPNFRLTHSIEVRANPQSCTACHSSAAFCIQCHTKGAK